MVGQTVSHYKVLEKLGEGGMGTVYKAHDLKLDRVVALKFLSAQALASEQDRVRFIQEAKTASALDHPNICTIHEIDETLDGRLFIAMPAYGGTTLKKIIESGPMNLDDALDVAIQISDGLYAAQKQGIVHRDIKSSNVMVVDKGQAKIMDFGLARRSGATQLTKSGTMLGTAAYMSPEQARGDKVDHRTDIWSLGVVLYEMVTGSLPFKSELSEAVVYQILKEEPPPIATLRSDAPAELDRIVKKAMQKDVTKRYENAGEVLNDLKSLRKNLESGKRLKLAKEVLRKKRLFQYSGAACLAALFFIALYHVLGPKPTVVPEKPIAVLPFQILGGSQEDEYFGDGMTESIITDLAKLRGLLVVSRAAVNKYKGKEVDIREVGRELHVNHVLEGSIQRSGDRLRVNVQLTDASTGKQVWADRFDREVGNIFALQDDISRNTIAALQVTLSASEEREVTARPTENLAAYELYLRGRYYFNKRNIAGTDSAVALFEGAITIDPSFALAYAALGSAYTYMFFNVDPQKRWEEKAFVAIEKALSIDPNLAEAHVAKGGLLWTPANHFPHDRAISEYKRAIEKNPNSDQAHEKLGFVYMHIGLLDKAQQEYQIAVRINPASVFAQSRVGIALLYDGKYESALGVLKNIPEEFEPWTIAMQTATALFFLGKVDDALSLLDKVSNKLSNDNLLLSTQAMILASLGDRQRALDKIKSAAEQEKTQFGHFHHSAFNIGSAYALMHENQLAIEWLQKAANDGFPCYPKFEKDPNLNNIRNDPQFISFMEDLKKEWERFRATL